MPRSRISSIVRVTPCIAPIPSATIAIRGSSPSRLESLARSRAMNAADGA